MTNEPRLTVEEAAAALGKHPVTVRRMIAAGVLNTERDGGRVFIPAAAVETLMHRLCPHCGKTFAPGRYATRRRYCSPACCWAATYAARKAANPATRRPGRPPNPRTVAAPATPPERLAAVLDAVRNR